MVRRRCAAIVLVASALVAGCAQRSSSSTTTLRPLVGPRAATTTSAAPSTLPPTTISSIPAVTAVPDGKDVRCAYAEPAPAGEITFEINSRLWAVAPDGSELHCLTPLNSGQQGTVRWSPKADQVVLNDVAVFGPAGRHNVGLPTTSGVGFVAPDGTSLVAASASGRTVWEIPSSGTGGSTTVTALANTALVVSHPAGGVLIAAGKSGDGRTGVFATPEGGAGAAQSLLLVTSKETTVDEVVVDPGGEIAYVSVAGASQTRLLRLELATLLVTEVTSSPSPIAGLVTGPTEGSVAWRSGLCNSTTSTWLVDTRTGSPVQVGIGSPIATLSTEPVGWLDAARLLVAARPLGCKGPFDLWLWNTLDGSLAPVVSAVAAAATRVAAPPATPFGIRPGAVPQKV